MKKVITLLLAAGLVIGAASAANAVDIKAKGLWHNAMSFADRNFEKHNGSDKMQNATRIRTQIDVIASESLKGVVYFEIGPQNWGKGADGASLGTDGKVVKVRYNYVDWVTPQTDAKVRMGLQNFSLPGFALPNVILGGGGADGAGITLSTQFTKNIGATLFWLRAENDNTDSATDYGKQYHYSDAMDFTGITLPLKFDGVKVTPWGMYGAIGRDSLPSASPASGQNGVTMADRLLPAMGNGLAVGNYDRHGNAWWAGVASELTYFDPFRFALDAAYGSVDMGSYRAADNKNFDMERAGWFASILGEYKMDYFTPGVLFWYASGDDSNAYNGSERMPTVEGSWTASSYGYDDNFGRDSCDMIGLSNTGTMGVYLQAKDISFMEDLTHIFRVGFVKGTNNTEMVRSGWASLDSNDGLYLTTADKAWEVNFDTQYKIYKDLTLGVELGWINLDLNEDVWKNANSYKDNIYRGAVTLQYTF